MCAAVAPADALADIHIRAPTRGNRRLDQLFEAVNGDLQVKAWWHMAGINAQRLGLTDHSWVHIQIVTNIALRGFGGEMFAGGSTPTTAVLAPNTTVPLSVSWSGRAVAVEVAGSRLPLD